MDAEANAIAAIARVQGISKANQGLDNEAAAQASSRVVQLERAVGLERETVRVLKDEVRL